MQASTVPSPRWGGGSNDLASPLRGVTLASEPLYARLIYGRSSRSFRRNAVSDLTPCRASLNQTGEPVETTPHMPMKRTSIRVPENLYTVIEAEAERDGISVSQWMRESALLRVAYRMGERGVGNEVRYLVEEMVAAERERQEP